MTQLYPLAGRPQDLGTIGRTWGWRSRGRAQRVTRNTRRYGVIGYGGSRRRRRWKWRRRGSRLAERRVREFRRLSILRRFEVFGCPLEHRAQDDSGPEIAKQEAVGKRIDQDPGRERVRACFAPQTGGNRRREIVAPMAQPRDLNQPKPDQDLREPVGDLIEVRIRGKERIGVLLIQCSRQSEQEAENDSY